MKTKQKIGKNFTDVKAARKYSAGIAKPLRSLLMAAMIQEDNKTLTENLAVTYKSTLDALVDLFAMGGAIRSRSDAEVIQLFIKAFAQDQLLAMKLLFHMRNVRGGMGERKVFRTILKWLGDNYPDVVGKNIENIAFFGRFDDLYSLLDSGNAMVAFELIKNQLENDIKNYEENKPISLLAKWLKSENTSSQESRATATKIREYLGWTPKQYRKTLSVLREYLNVVEQKMSAGEWPAIDFEKVPSKASLNYRKAFAKHEPERYTAFIEAVKKGEKKINASALFPYEIVEKILYKGADEQTMDVLWDALPDYMEDKGGNLLVMADVSGSMSMGGGRPMATSIALAIYTAERNQGPFAGHFITFTDNPHLQQVVGNNIREKIRCIGGEVGYSTNLQSAFEMVLRTAIHNKIKQKDMPAQILVISDMEFNAVDGNRTNLQTIQARYAEAGYQAPQLVFWNVNSRQNNVPATANEKGVLLVSGSSPSVFKTLLSGKQYTPIDQMLETLSDKQYDRIVI